MLRSSVWTPVAPALVRSSSPPWIVLSSCGGSSMSASSLVPGKFGSGFAFAATFFLTSEMNRSASSPLRKIHARATDPVRPARPPDPTPASMSPALMPTSTPQLSPALTLPLIVTLTVPSARYSLIPSTPAPKSNAATRTDPEIPRCDELRTHSAASGSPLGPVPSLAHSPPRMRQIASWMPPRICPAGTAGDEHDDDRADQQQGAEVLGGCLAARAAGAGQGSHSGAGCPRTALAARVLGPVLGPGPARDFRVRRRIPVRPLRRIRGASRRPRCSRARGTHRERGRPEALAAAPHRSDRPFFNELKRAAGAAPDLDDFAHGGGAPGDARVQRAQDELEAAGLELLELGDKRVEAAAALVDLDDVARRRCPSRSCGGSTGATASTVSRDA